jgi:4-hydroxybenzoate polyprenyltransferase
LINKLIILSLAIVKSARPVHWIKNLALFAAPVLTGTLLIPQYFFATFWAFVAFSMATSASYILNDVLDAPRDRKHPIKKERPIARGALPYDLALTIALGLALASLYLANLLSGLFFWTIAGYIALQILYSLGLKKIAVVDIIIIASGFIMRVYAGAFVIDAHLSAWFLLTVISVALFLASGKRRAELAHSDHSVTRESLHTYTKELLNSYVTMFGNAAWISWSLYTFFESPRADVSTLLYLADISKATTISKFLMSTIPVVIFIIMRYEIIIFSDKSEAPERVLLTDKFLVGGIVAWILMVLYILYGGIAIL